MRIINPTQKIRVIEFLGRRLDNQDLIGVSSFFLNWLIVLLERMIDIRSDFRRVQWVGKHLAEMSRDWLLASFSQLVYNETVSMLHNVLFVCFICWRQLESSWSLSQLRSGFEMHDSGNMEPGEVDWCSLQLMDDLLMKIFSPRDHVIKDSWFS